MLWPVPQVLLFCRIEPRLQLEVGPWGASTNVSRSLRGRLQYGTIETIPAVRRANWKTSVHLRLSAVPPFLLKLEGLPW